MPFFFFWIVFFVSSFAEYGDCCGVVCVVYDCVVALFFDVVFEVLEEFFAVAFLSMFCF